MMRFSSRSSCSLAAVLIVGFVATVLSSPVLAETEPTLELQSAKRVAKMKAEVRELTESTASEDAIADACRHNCADASPKLQAEARRLRRQREAKIDQLVGRIDQEVDSWVSRTIRPEHMDRTRLARGLQRIVGSPATVLISNDSLFISYMVPIGYRMGLRGPSPTIRAYRELDGRFVPSASTGSGLAGLWNVTVQELHSPRPGETWLIVSGYMTGSNGPNNTMRIFAYDGTKFRAAWSPPSAWGTFKITPTPDGFAIDGDYYHENRLRHDKYTLLEDGVHLVRRK